MAFSRVVFPIISCGVMGPVISSYQFRGGIFMVVRGTPMSRAKLLCDLG